MIDDRGMRSLRLLGPAVLPSFILRSLVCDTSFFSSRDPSHNHPPRRCEHKSQAIAESTAARASRRERMGSCDSNIDVFAENFNESDDGLSDSAKRGDGGFGGGQGTSPTSPDDSAREQIGSGGDCAVGASGLLCRQQAVVTTSGGGGGLGLVAYTDDGGQYEGSAGCATGSYLLHT